MLDKPTSLHSQVNDPPTHQLHSHSHLPHSHQVNHYQLNHHQQSHLYTTQPTAQQQSTQSPAPQVTVEVATQPGPSRTTMWRQRKKESEPKSRKVYSCRKCGPAMSDPSHTQFHGARYGPQAFPRVKGVVARATASKGFCQEEITRCYINNYCHCNLLTIMLTL